MQPFKAFKLTTVEKSVRAEFVECKQDDLDPGELVVRVAYSDVNYKDALAATGKGRILLRPSCIGGIDLAGTVTESTGKESEEGRLKKLGTKEILFRKNLNLEKLKPLDKATWAGAVDNLGGEVLAWMASTMKFNGVIASIGLAASPSLNTTVMPFILRGASLLGINSTDAPSPELEREVWGRLASDLRPPMLKELARTIPFADLPKVFD